jgi:anti-sigma regulatory factor (Ser/Thr protein kinase)
MLQEARFILRTIEQARDLGSMLATACPEPERVVVGLTELLLNAIEHGNLGITYEEKTKLDTRQAWQAEVARRLELPENKPKRVEFLFERLPTEIRFTIRDEGDGFEWRRFLQIDPRRAFDTHGRGIVMARAYSFTSVDYSEAGNEVVARVAL